MNLEPLLTWAIDEKAVEADGYTWEKMFYKQLFVPVLVLVGVTIVGQHPAIDPPTWWYSGATVLFAYSMWPAVGAYYHWTVGDGR